MTSITPSSPDALGRVDTPSDFTTCFAISGGVTFGRTMSALTNRAVHNEAVGQTDEHIARSGGGKRGVRSTCVHHSHRARTRKRVLVRHPGAMYPSPHVFTFAVRQFSAQAKIKRRRKYHGTSESLTCHKLERLSTRYRNEDSEGTNQPNRRKSRYNCTTAPFVFYDQGKPTKAGRVQGYSSSTGDHS